MNPDGRVKVSELTVPLLVVSSVELGYKKSFMSAGQLALTAFCAMNFSEI